MTRLISLAFVLAACGGKSTPTTPPTNGSGSASADECAADACGPRLGMPSQQCKDGSVGGNTGRCIRKGDGNCSWEIRECPAEAGEGECIKTGCSGTICTEPGKDVFTTCEMKPEYACYANARCAKQPSGACGWTQTPELAACLKNPPPLK
ncbi:MAG TPA: hypothetical protein VFQ53_02845 [Kofleriaceae bacterium]|nr:hypothetical protein [Kofleriaceae bacterium]